jgi:hypothetical protein
MFDSFMVSQILQEVSITIFFMYIHYLGVICYDCIKNKNV